MKIIGIYQIQSISKPERAYIGSAVDIRRRWSEHLSKLRRNKHESPKLQNHFNKYGEADLIFRIIEPCFPQFLTAVEDTYLKPLPYFNIRTSAYNSLGCTQSIESNKKRGDSIRLAWKNKVMSLEEIKNRSDGAKGRPSNMKGKHHSVESCLKMSKSSKEAWELRENRHHSEETKQKIRNSRTEEFRRNASEFHKGKNFNPPVSEETRENLRISHLGQTSWNKGLSGYSTSMKGKHYIKQKGRTPWNKGLKNPEGISGKISKLKIA